MYGEVTYDKDGKPVCELCGNSYTRLMSHVWQKHNMLARQYKKRFGLNVSKSIISEESKRKSHDAVMKNYQSCVDSNLIRGGRATRYNKGHKGRTKDMVSAQDLKRIKKLHTYQDKNKLKETCRKLGKSNLGNKKRWSPKKI